MTRHLPAALALVAAFLVPAALAGTTTRAADAPDSSPPPPDATSPWGSENYPGKPDSKPPYSAHYFILNKAIDYLRRSGVDLLPDWPLEDYRDLLLYGAYWADFPNDPVGVNCVWGGSSIYEGTCDALHHYLTGNDIHEDSVTGASIGHGGGLGVPEYSQVLYDLALKFWPGGSPVPDIRTLPYRTSGGFINLPASPGGAGPRLGPIVVGGHPFAYDVVETCVRNSCGWGTGCIGPTTEEAYTWPGFVGTRWNRDTCSWTRATPAESTRASLIYLGWTIHLVEDLSTLVHAQNLTGLRHREVENDADALILGGWFANLPLRPQAGSTYGNGLEVRPDFFHNDWAIEQFATESALLAAPGIPLEVFGVPGDYEMELDTAMKMVAGILVKFFSELELPKDAFEPNNTPGTAASLPSGDHRQLTIHAPLDADLYQVPVTQDYSDVRIELVSGSAQRDLVLNVE
jgi:hypothetical protein